jgi:hypothetical protein
MEIIGIFLVPLDKSVLNIIILNMLKPDGKGELSMPARPWRMYENAYAVCIIIRF